MQQRLQEGSQYQSLVSTKSQGSMSVGETVTNMTIVCLKIYLILNVLQISEAAKSAEEKYELLKQQKKYVMLWFSLNNQVDGGKDSLSMSVKDGNENN